MSKWRPANRGEYVAFVRRFCQQCVKDVEGKCLIHLRALTYRPEEARYPAEWTTVFEVPTCTGFLERK